MSGRLVVFRTAVAGVLGAAWLGASACGDGGPLFSGGLWSAHEVQLEVRYDTLPPGGSTPLTVELDTLRASAGELWLWARVTATNLSNRALVGSTSPCGWAFTAYDNPERKGEPFWTEPRWRDDGSDEGLNAGGIVVVCGDFALHLQLAPGATQAFPGGLLGRVDEEARALGPRTWYFAAQLRGSLGDDGPSQWLTEPLPAGALVIAP